MARKLIKSEVIEVKIIGGSTTNKIQLPDVPNLRNVHLWNIESWTLQEIPVSILSNTPLVNQALYNSIFLTLQSYNGKNFMWQKPLLSFKNVSSTIVLPAVANTFVSWFPTLFAGQKVNWPKSYIEIANVALIPAATVVLLLDISYSESEAIEKKDKKASFRKQS